MSATHSNLSFSLYLSVSVNYNAAVVSQSNLSVRPLPAPLLHRRRSHTSNRQCRRKRHHHYSLLGTKPNENDNRKAVIGPDPRFRSRCHVAVAETGPILLPKIRRLCPGFNLLRQVYDQIGRPYRDFSGGLRC